MKMKTSQLLSIIYDKFNDTRYHFSELYVIMKYAYSEDELRNERYYIESCIYNDNGVLWFNDWYEGQEYIELLAIMNDEQLIELVKKSLTIE